MSENAPRRRTPEVTSPTDVHDVDLDGVRWVTDQAPSPTSADSLLMADLGPLIVPVRDDAPIQIGVDDSGRATAVTAVAGPWRLSLSVFAAPRTRQIWSHMLEEIGQQLGPGTALEPSPWGLAALRPPLGWDRGHQQRLDTAGGQPPPSAPAGTDSGAESVTVDGAAGNTSPDKAGNEEPGNDGSGSDQVDDGPHLVAGVQGSGWLVRLLMSWRPDAGPELGESAGQPAGQRAGRPAGQPASGGDFLDAVVRCAVWQLASGVLVRRDGAPLPVGAVIPLDLTGLGLDLPGQQKPPGRYEFLPA